MEVDMAPFAGSTFRIFLPGTDAAVADELEESSHALPPGSATVLVVEDEEMLRGLIRQVLQSAGYFVLEAEDGLFALETVAKASQTIDLLVTDVVMPGDISGATVEKRVRELRPGTKILFISGYTDDAVVHHVVEQEQVPFLQKPFAPAALVRKVRELLLPVEETRPESGETPTVH